MKPDELVQVVRRLNPTNEPGKVTLITRYGADQVRAAAADIEGVPLGVLTGCDPCAGQ